MKNKDIPAIVITVVSLSALVSMTFAAHDRFTLKAPNGVAFSELRGYETWPVVAPSQTDDGLKTILANPAMINAYKEVIPGNSKPFPEGSIVVKIEWSKRKNSVSPYPVTVPNTLNRLHSSRRIPRDPRTRMDGDMPSLCMM